MTCYVYSHTRNDTGAIFYIGKGSGNRIRSHKSRNPYWRSIVSKAGGFSYQIIASGLNHSEAYAFEHLIISEIKKQTNVVLVNLTDGGEGGLNVSAETKQKQRLAKLGRKLTQEHKQKISAANMKRVYKRGYKINLSEESRLARSKKASSCVRDADFRLKISIGKLNSGYKHSDETKSKISSSKKGKPWTEEQRSAIMSGRLKGGDVNGNVS